MNLLKKVLCTSIAAGIFISNIFAGSGQSQIVNAETYSEAENYGDYLFYEKVDEDENGIYDYIRISDCDKSAVSVDIPAEIDGLPVTSIGYGAFFWCENLTSIKIPDSVTSIGGSAFHLCSSLTSIEIPDSVTSIGDFTFEDCSSLESITIPDSVTSIEYHAFCGTPWLETKRTENPLVIVNSLLIDGQTCSGDVEIPDGVTLIGDDAFSGCTGLISITIPDSVISIGDYAFSGCESLISITIPDSVTSSIGYDVFKDCTSLTSITIGNGVTSIKYSAFSECTSLASITIGNGVTFIEYDAFSECTSLTNIYVSKNNDNYSSIDGVLFNKDKTEIIKYPKGKEDSQYSIPDSVTSIGYCAFSDCTSLTSIEIPDSITYIGKGCIYLLRKLEKCKITKQHNVY